jgi:hypothetical protein
MRTYTTERTGMLWMVTVLAEKKELLEASEIKTLYYPILRSLSN